MRPKDSPTILINSLFITDDDETGQSTSLVLCFLATTQQAVYSLLRWLFGSRWCFTWAV